MINNTVFMFYISIYQVQNKDFSGYACLIIVILSHGSRHEEIAAKDGHYSIDDDMLFPILKNRSLNDKPKLFFIQACKGSMETLGPYKDAVPFQAVGNASEILKCYSTFEGMVMDFSANHYKFFILKNFISNRICVLSV